MKLQVLCTVMLAATLVGAALGANAIIVGSTAAIWAFHLGRLRTLAYFAEIE